MNALLVDDSETMRIYLAYVLRECGWDVVQAASGAEALRLLETGPRPQVVLLDFDMPGMNGLAVMERIHFNPAWRGIKIMMVTSHTEQTLLGRALGSGVDAYLVKPCSAQVLADKLAKLGFTQSARA